ncbi:uncharacterized protein LOC142985371 isoform X2 [Anticarsia gemmatalis]
MSSGQSYRGYPYVNQIVTDAPSIDAATASKWANLPRKVLSPSVPGSSGITAPKENQPSSSGSGPSIPPKKDIDENPVVYIDLPQADGGSDVTSIESPEAQPQYVQDTILYDPFEDRRIDRPKEDAASQNSSSSSQASPVNSRPVRPDTLDLIGRGTGSGGPSTSAGSSGLPAFLEKESFVYGAQGSDGFPLSPIPISEFPEPPPAYTELPPTPSPQTPSRQPEPEPVPPRTQVIVPVPDPASPVGIMTYDRKFLTCHHCTSRVHTLLIRENGYMTYLIAFTFFIFFMPLVYVVFFTDCFKHKNHYCPNCNKMIGYELPVFGKKIHLVNG